MAGGGAGERAVGGRQLTGPAPGLCVDCAHVRTVRSGKGSTFYLCERSRVDPAFPRYPRIPVLRCRGYEPRGGGEALAAEGGAL